MKTVSVDRIRADITTVMDEVCKDHVPTVISREHGEDVVMLPLSYFNGLKETLHLLGSPINAARLFESIAQLRAGNVQVRELIQGH